MRSNLQRVYAGLSILLFSVLAAPVTAAPIEIQFVRETGSTSSILESVGFDGTSFTSGATALETIVPTWTAMSYDPLAQLMYFVRETGSGSSLLESVGFDGTSFTGGATSLETIVPTWTAMSYDPLAQLMYFVRETGSGSSLLESVGFDGTSFTGGATSLETIVPTWTAMSVVQEQAGPTPVPTPGTMPLLLAGLALVAIRRRMLASSAE